MNPFSHYQLPKAERKSRGDDIILSKKPPHNFLPEVSPPSPELDDGTLADWSTLHAAVNGSRDLYTTSMDVQRHKKIYGMILIYSLYSW